MACLQGLSTEILLHIGKLLNDADLAHLSETNCFLSEMFSETLVTRSLADKPRVVEIPALTWAIDHTKRHLVKRIVSRPRFNPHTASTRSALHDAAVYGDCEIMATLLSAGYDPNLTIGRKQYTALHICAMNGQTQAAKLLLDNGALIGAKDVTHKTAFFLAIESSKMLLSQARVAIAGKADMTKLIRDIDHRVVKTVRVLAENGAQHEVSAPNILHVTALYSAVCSCIAPNSGPDMTVGTEVIRFLVANGALPAPNNGQTAGNPGRTPLQAAAANRTANRNALSYFLDIGSNPNFKDQFGSNLLTEATAGELDTFPIVELLLRRGAIIDGNFDFWPIFDALDLPDEEVVDRLITLLLVHGADFGSIAGKCFTVAASHGMLGVMKSIFTSNAATDINISINLWDMPEDEIKTPLQFGLSLERQDMLEFLVANGVTMTQGERVLVEKVLGREIN
ncbi:hypothetical protein Q9L58_006667 [Maublancomyces gigas]|uniref:Ankyrin repeat protein n=1 Tax=Discina gigas TaxID=1032678 RepID=A0ABR3GEM4_9PEZI